jgi:AmmeMemoRadiSam system protein B
VRHEGRAYFLLRDPAGLAENELLVPVELGPLLALLDGSRSINALSFAFFRQTGIALSDSEIMAVVDRLDAALMLEGERVELARRQALAAYREAPARPPALAGAVYPAQRDALAAALDEYFALSGITPESPQKRKGTLAGILSPHIDFERGYQTYARLWSEAAPLLSDVETVVILGTDHAGGPGSVTLTRQHYATPFGTLPTDLGIVDEIAAQLGEDAAFAEELHHRREHSVELAAVWLQHALCGRRVSVVPVLCGYIPGREDDSANGEWLRSVEAVVPLLAGLVKRKRTVIVAAGDLAHVGPGFGDQFPYDSGACARLAGADLRSVAIMCAGDAEGFLRDVQAEEEARRVCGLTPIYVMLRALGNTVEGEVLGYEQCPADPFGGSFVSIAGALLFERGA